MLSDIKTALVATCTDLQNIVLLGESLVKRFADLKAQATPVDRYVTSVQSMNIDVSPSSSACSPPPAPPTSPNRLERVLQRLPLPSVRRPAVFDKDTPLYMKRRFKAVARRRAPVILFGHEEPEHEMEEDDEVDESYVPVARPSKRQRNEADHEPAKRQRDEADHEPVETLCQAFMKHRLCIKAGRCVVRKNRDMSKPGKSCAIGLRHEECGLGACLVKGHL